MANYTIQVTAIKPTAPAVSLIVVNWNGKHLLEPCLAALAGQTFRDFELIVVDNGSTDGSAKWVAGRYPDARLVCLDRNLGFSGGGNAGVKAARGDLIGLVNNDAQVEPTWLEALVEAMAAHPQAGAADSKVFFNDRRDILWAAGGDYSIAGSVAHRGYLMQEAEAKLSSTAGVFIAIACAVLYRRTALDRVGLFDEDFFSGYEDVDLSFRMHAAGFQVLNVPGAVAYHRVSETAQINSDFYVFHGQKNVLYTFLKNMPAPLLLKYWPLHLAYTLGALAYFTRHGRLGAALRAKWFVLRRWNQVMDKRRDAQKLRVVPVRDLEAQFSRAWLRPKVGKLLA